MSYHCEPSVEVTKLQDDEISFVLRDTTLAMANSFRR